MTTFSTKVALEILIDSLERKNRLLLHANHEILHRLQLSQKFSSVTKKSIVDSVHHKFIEIAVKVQDVMHDWCEKKCLELDHCEKHID